MLDAYQFKYINDFNNQVCVICEISKSHTAWLWMRFLKKLDMMTFKHNKVNINVAYEGHSNCLKIFL